MLHKLGGGKLVQPGDRVALVFRPDEAAQFANAFYGCIFAAVIPVAIEPPVTREVSADIRYIHVRTCSICMYMYVCIATVVVHVYTVKTLLKDTPEVRTPPKSGHLTKSQLHMKMYYLPPEMRTPP